MSVGHKYSVEEVEAHPYCDPPCNQAQMAFVAEIDDGAELMAKARTWASLHFSEWSDFKAFAQEQTDRRGYASAKWCLERMRDEHSCKCPNAYAPAFARIAMEQNKHLRFRCGRSKTDGHTTAVLP